jgi:hypothetical protein
MVEMIDSSITKSPGLKSCLDDARASLNHICRAIAIMLTRQAIDVKQRLQVIEIDFCQPEA